jgi:hypothetical protein
VLVLPAPALLDDAEPVPEEAVLPPRGDTIDTEGVELERFDSVASCNTISG